MKPNPKLCIECQSKKPKKNHKHCEECLWLKIIARVKNK